VRVRGDGLQTAAVGVWAVQLAGLAIQQLAHPGGHDAVEVLVRGDGGDVLAQRGQPGEGPDPPARLLVEAGVLDRVGDEPRRVDQEVEHALVELAWRRRVHDHDADDLARAPGDRHRGHRLEALLLELGDVLHPRIGERVLADERGLPAPRHPPGQPLVEAQLDAPHQVGVHAGGRPHPQPVAIAQVDEAGVAVGGLADQADDAVEDAVELL
jgi:hypothetical protein